MASKKELRRQLEQLRTQLGLLETEYFELHGKAGRLEELKTELQLWRENNIDFEIRKTGEYEHVIAEAARQRRAAIDKVLLHIKTLESGKSIKRWTTPEEV